MDVYWNVMLKEKFFSLIQGGISGKISVHIINPPSTLELVFFNPVSKPVALMLTRTKKCKVFDQWIKNHPFYTEICSNLLILM